MNPQLNTQQVVLVLGTALAIGSVLVLIIFGLLRSLRRQRKERKMPLGSLRPQDESTLLIGSLQGVVTRLKSRERELETMLRDVEQRAEISTRTLEILLRTAPQGLMIFEPTGILSVANQAAKNMLNVDTWARRRYSEIFPADSPIAAALSECLQNPKVAKQSRVKFSPAPGSGRAFDVGLIPFHSRGGNLAGVVCTFVLVSGRDPV